VWFDDLEVQLVSDGVIWVDVGGPFGLVPHDLYRRYLEPDQNHCVPLFLTCMLIRSRSVTILVDTGLGDKWDEVGLARWRLDRSAGGLLENLAKLGVRPDQVDIVINTHLHADHCAGNTRWEGTRLSPVFPRAEYWVQRLEWADACHPDARTRSTYQSENFTPLFEAGQLRLHHGEVAVTDQVRCVPTPGHTRGHQSVLLEAGDWSGLYVADMATYAIQMARPAWLTAYDVLPLENVRTKESWRTWALTRSAWMFFEHDPVLPVARLIEEEGVTSLQPVEEADALTDYLPKRQPLRG